MNRILRSLGALPIDRLARHPDMVLAGLVALVVTVLIIPMPTPVLDGLLATNITLSALILAAVLLSERTLSVSSFPTLLLLTTLFRLTLNVSTTRQILSKGDAGDVVQAFGEFVLAGDVIVGLVIFLIITLVQFLVIAKGAERVAEVGARFTLDAMPGKQISIDAALRSGSINEEEAASKRDELGRESQFYGAMDGAMKFIKGDAIAGLIITAINLVAGIAIGVLRFGMSTSQAIDAYCVMSVGDGLVSQIPALLITLSAGVLTTRVSSNENRTDIGANLRNELFTSHKVLGLAAGFAALLAMMPGLPVAPFVLLSAILGGGAYARYRALRPKAGSSKLGSTIGQAEAMKEKIQAKVKQAKAQRAAADKMAPAVPPIGIDLGVDLSRHLGFLDHAAEETELLQETFPQLRDALYLETGIRFPGVRVRSAVPGLAPDACVIRVKDVPVASETISIKQWLAIEAPEKLQRLGVNASRVPHPGGPGVASLVPAESADAVAAMGVRVWSPGMVIAIHVAKILRRHAKLFLGLQETSELVERLEKVYPALVREVVPKIVGLTQLTDILQRLIDEGVSIRDLKSIFEALAVHGPNQTDNVALTELVRCGLSLQLAHAFIGSSDRMPVVLLDEIIEDSVRGAITVAQGGTYLALDPEIRNAILASIAKTLSPVVLAGLRPIILTHSEIRRYVRKLIEENLPEVAVLSFQELPAQLTIQPLGRASLRDDRAIAA
jgi:type III secretion protein V